MDPVPSLSAVDPLSWGSSLKRSLSGSTRTLHPDHHDRGGDRVYAGIDAQYVFTLPTHLTELGGESPEEMYNREGSTSPRPDNFGESRAENLGNRHPSLPVNYGAALDPVQQPNGKTQVAVAARLCSIDARERKW